uniref:Isochorismatase family protein n=1 Tax=Janibacter limosus TaxID=53458 RepID=A0AC61U868_9MICO|nr:isochorismatase family protein [Janibacter limosus]
MCAGCSGGQSGRSCRSSTCAPSTSATARRGRSRCSRTTRGFLFEGDDHTAALSELDLSAATEVVKTRDDAFVGTDPDSVLTDPGVEAVVIIGVSTHTCVLLTAAHAFALDREVVLVRDAIASHRP